MKYFLNKLDIKFLITLLLISSLLFAIPLSEFDYKSIEKQRRTETLVFEHCSPLKSTAFNLIGVQFDRFIDQNFYVGGVAYGAIDGGRSGYALGAFHIGYLQDLSDSLFIDIKTMIGGSGGGGVPTKGGLLFQPQIALGYRINPFTELRVGIGKYYSMDNDFEANIFNIGISISSFHLFIPLQLTP